VRLLALVLDSPHALAEAQRRVRARFACTRDSAAKELIAATENDRCSQIVLAYAEFCPERFGFVTQETLNRERYNDLKQRAERLAAALFWLRLRRVFRSNPLVFGSWRILAWSWLGLAVFAWRAGLLGLSEIWIGLLLMVPPMLRVGHWAGLGRALGRHAPGAGQWTWRDGVVRCSKELRVTVAGAFVPSEDRIMAHLTALNRKIAEVPLKEALPLVTPPGRLPALWTTSVISWLVMILVFGGAVRSGVHRVRTEGWRIIGIGSGNPIQTPVVEVDPELKSANADWSFGDPRNHRVVWKLPKPAAVPPVEVRTRLEAKPDQVAFALVEGERELLPFLRHSVKPLIAIRVPTESGVGLILFDTGEGTVAERRVYVVGQEPPAPSWLRLGGHDVVFLGASTQGAVPENSGPENPAPGKT
jgi:hypothetical protein